MPLSLIVAALALQAPAPKPAPDPSTSPAAPAREAEAPKSEHWIADFDQAIEVAKKNGKDLLVDFTGSDWCKWCILLHKEVFAFDSFLDAAEGSYVLVALDYPRSEEAKKKVPNPTRNADLAKKYEIESFPTVLLMSADGEVFGQTGYREGGPEKYVADLKSRTSVGKKTAAALPELTKKYATASGAEQATLVESATDLLSAQVDASPYSARLAPIVRDALKLDPDNKNGMKLKAVEALLKAGQGDEEINSAAKALDPKNEKGLLERVVAAQVATIQSREQIAPWLKQLDDLLAAGKLKDVKIGKQMLANAAFMSKKHLSDLGRAKGYATKLKELGLDSPDDAPLKQFVDDILSATG